MKRFLEFFIEKLIFLCGIAAIAIVGLIFLFLLKEGFSLFLKVPIASFLAGTRWYPISHPPAFGILPLVLGSLVVTLGAAAFAVPLGVASAVYIAEVASPRAREILKVSIEIMAAIPSVVIGFIGMMVLAPWIQRTFNLPTGLTALCGSVMLGLMAMPTIVSIAEDALTSVPKGYKEAALAIGATHWQAIYRVILPAASSGIVAAVMLGIGRVVGETMAVMMLTGNSARIPSGLLEPVRTLTATIAAEMGETVRGSSHYHALFAIGIVLFLITFFINFVADYFMHKRTR